MSISSSPESLAVSLVNDMDYRISMACRLAQTSTPAVEEALEETPLMRAAYAVAIALMTGADAKEAQAEYDRALNQFLSDFNHKVSHYRGELISRE